MLRDSEEMDFTSLFDNSKVLLDQLEDGITIISEDGTILKANRTYCELLGYSHEELIGKNIIDLITTQSLEENPPRFEPLASGKSLMFRRDLKRKVKPPVTVEVTSRQQNGKIFSITRDITDTVKIEQQYMESQSKLLERVKELHGLYETSSILLDEDSKMFDKLSSITNVVKRSYQYPDITHCRIILDDTIFTSNDFAEGKWVLEEELVINKYARGKISVYISDNCPESDEGPFLKEERDLIQALANKIQKYIHDQELQDELIQTKIEMLQSQKMKALGQLAGGMAHDLNNILMVILGFTEKIENTKNPQSEMIRKDTSYIKESVFKAASLLENLLTFSKKQNMKPVPTDVNQLVEKLTPHLQRLIGQDIKFQTFISAELLAVMIDPVQLEQVIVNLVINARQAMKTGGKFIIRTNMIENCSQCDCDEGVQISFEDTGIGIAEKELNRIFEPFYTTKDEGAGLGLATSYGIITQHGGTIDVSSTVGEGTKITISLPFFHETETQYKDQKDEQFVTESQHKILLLEDNEEIAELMITLLHLDGHTVTVFVNPKKVNTLSDGEIRDYDLVISDIIMPDENGVSVVKKLKSINPHLKHLYISGYSKEILERYNEQYDPKSYLKKPFSNQELLSKVSRILLD